MRHPFFVLGFCIVILLGGCVDTGDDDEDRYNIVHEWLLDRQDDCNDANPDMQTYATMQLTQPNVILSWCSDTRRPPPGHTVPVRPPEEHHKLERTW